MPNDPAQLIINDRLRAFVEEALGLFDIAELTQLVEEMENELRKTN